MAEGTDDQEEQLRNLLAILKREAAIAIGTAAAITLVLLVRRWTTALLGEGVLNEEILAENTVVADIMRAIDQRIRTREENTDAKRRTPKRQGRSSGSAGGDSQTDT